MITVALVIQLESTKCKEDDQSFWQKLRGSVSQYSNFISPIAIIIGIRCALTLIVVNLPFYRWVKGSCPPGNSLRISIDTSKTVSTWRIAH